MNASSIPHWPGMGANPKLVCLAHGEQPWGGHLACSRCGVSYSTADPASPMHAPPRCRNCGERFLPIKGAKPRTHFYSATPCCSVCFEEAPGGAFQDAHDKDSPYCLGEDCPFHGPMLRKLARRAERAVWAARKSVVVDHVVNVQVPGELGERQIVVQEEKRV